MSEEWNAETIRQLRQRLSLTQQAFARELGVRQQTVSDWEIGIYRPRGASARVLSLVAERAGFRYGATESSGQPSDERDGPNG